MNLNIAQNRRIPKLCKNGNTAFVTWKKKRIYFGKYGTQESESAYRQWSIEFISNGYYPPLPKAEGENVTVAVLCVHYLQRADFRTYTKGHQDLIKHVIRYLIKWYGSEPATLFGPMKLRAIRDQLMLGAHTEPFQPLTRSTIGKWVAIIRAIFKYGASLEHIPVSVYQALTTLEPLKAGRSGAKESEPIKPVPQGDIDAVLPHLPKTLQALVQLQLLSGARPAELLNLRPCDINREEDVWTATLAKHKTALKGKERILPFGPKAQNIIKPYLIRNSQEYLFKPKEAQKERWEKCATHRRANRKNNPKKSTRTLGEHYSAHSYCRAIKRACIKAQVPVWTPYRLRHNAATNIRKEYGLEAAQVILGHSSMTTTQIYAEKNISTALEIVKKYG